MSSRSLKLLALVAAVLIALLVAIEVTDDSARPSGESVLFADLRSNIEGIDKIAITKADYDTPVTIVRSGDKWVVTERDDYPASIAKVREIIMALADAKVVEVKTANPEMHHRLGLRDPADEGSKGTRITVSGAAVSYDVIFGNVAQGNFRYLRKADENQAWLVDQNPTIPATPGGWLLADIVDIGSASVQSVRIAHPDGSVIQISKDGESGTNYVVADIPQGRELSYPTVANGIAGALSGLTMEDVRAAQDAVDAIETVFETTDGLQITTRAVSGDDGNWVTVAAQVSAAAAAGAGDVDDAVAADSAADMDDVDTDSADDADNAVDAQEKADAINAIVSGWQYRISDYKFNLLTREWNDILQAPPDTE